MERTLIIAAAFLLAGGTSQKGHCAEEPNADASVPVIVSAPERWLNFSMGTPYPVAVRPDERQVVVDASCETVVYDLETGKRLHAWNDRFSLVCFSQDSRFLLTVQTDNVTVWNAETFVEVRRFTGRAPAWNEPNYRSYSTIAALSDDGGQVAIGNCLDSFHRGLPAAVLLHDTHSAQLLQTLVTPEKTQIRSVVFLPHGRRLLVRYASWREKDRHKPFYALWDTEQGNLVREFPAGAAARVSLDGRWIATGIPSPFQDKSTSLTVWETDTGKAVRTFENAHPMRDFVFSPNSERILTALGMKRTRDGKIVSRGRLVEWDVQSGETRYEVDNSPKPFATVAYSPDGGWRFATTEEPNGVDDDVDHWLCGWTVSTGARLPISEYLFASYNGDEDLFFFSNGDRFIDLAAPFAVRDVLTGNSVLTLPKYRGGMTEVAFMPDGAKFLAWHWNGGFLSDCNSGKQRKWRLPGTRAVFVDAGSMLFTYGYSGLYLTDVLTSEITWALSLDCDYSRFGAAISPDAKRIVVSQRINRNLPSASRIVLIETSQPDHPHVLESHATAVSFHPDGTRFVAASPDAIDELDAENGARIRTLWSPPGRPLSVVYSPDGNKVLACGVVGHSDLREPVGPKDQGWTMLWDNRTNRAITLEGHTAPVTAAAFDPTGTRCATGSVDKTIRLWDTTTGRVLCVFRGHLGAIHRIAYSPRENRILSAAEDGVAFWNVARFATRPVESTPLATSFTPVESVRAPTSRMSSNATGKLLPVPRGYRPASNPADRQAKWMVVEVGKVDRHDLPTDIQRWLSQARTTEYCNALPPSPPEPPSLYKLCGTSRDGRRKVYVSARDKKAVLHNEEGQVIYTWDGCSYSRQIAISSSGKEVAIVRNLTSAERRWCEVTVYDADSGVPKRVIRKDNARFSGSITIDPKERTIMIMAANRIVLHDFKTGDEMGALGRLEGGASRRAEYSRDGRFIVTSKFPDPAVTLYHPTTLALVKTFTNLFPIRWFEFSPDEKRLLVGQSFTDECELLTLWDVDSGRRLWSRAGPSSRSVTFSPDGRRFVSYGRRRYLSTLWDAEAGLVLCAVLTSGSHSSNMPVLGADGVSLHLGTSEGPRLWSRE